MIKGYGGTEWVGVEWDDLARGKHSGSANGHQYFHCNRGSCASFVKRKKVGDGGRRTFIQALSERYHVDNTARSGVIDSLAGTQVELVGMEREGRRQGNWNELRCISLRGLGVCSVVKNVKLESTLPLLKELDLGASLISELATLWEIACQFPTLRLLNASDNFFSQDVNGRRFEFIALKSPELSTLILNKTNVSWPQVIVLGERSPSLEELRLHQTGVNLLTKSLKENSSNSLHNLRILDLDGNKLGWGNLTGLRMLPNLTHLILSNNRIKDVRWKDRQVFLSSHLQHLNLNSNLIGDWTSITQLQAIKGLHTLHIRSNPLTMDLEDLEEDASVKSSRMTSSQIGIIARIPQLEVLDGAKISPDERRFAEKEYIREAVDASNGAIDEIVMQHPMLPRLCKCYDVDLDKMLCSRSSLKVEKAKDGTIAADLVLVKLIYFPTGGTGKELIARRIPSNTPVYKVRSLFLRVFKLPRRSHVRLTTVMTKDHELVQCTSMLDDCRLLKDYNASPTCEIRGQRINNQRKTATDLANC